MGFYALTIFCSAFLLFEVQPIIAKQVLPWFGGSAAVWTTCLVFFQTVLLLGYAYADWLVRRTSSRMQFLLHGGLLAASVLALPIIANARWKPTGTENPSLLILGLLTVTIGLPYFLLSSTSPLIQAWFARSFSQRSPYRLFALSNFASLLALISYPFVLEPWLSVRSQSSYWSTGYVLFVVLCIGAAWYASRAPVLSARAATGDDGGETPTIGRQFLWCTLAAVASFLLLAVSNHITQNVAAIPLLWLLPLTIYLLSFILCFDAPRWYQRNIFLGMLAAGLCVMAWTLADPDLTHQLKLQIGIFCIGLFIVCMFCHGEVARLKPAPRYLTRFYLMISFGGAMGSVLVGLVAPLVLPAYFELGFGLVACALLLIWQTRRQHLAYMVVAVVAAVFTLGAAVYDVHEFYERTIVVKRNFYGVLRVQEYGVKNGVKDATYRRSLVHGTILHGTQYLTDSLKKQPTTYYTATSGVGRILEVMHPTTTPLRVGIIGLGTGTIAAWGSKGDVYRFYDINPAVVEIANRDFTYLRDSEATIETPLGDARLSMEREPPQRFDLLAIDAFSSDAIPVHLMTYEALGIYRKHMKQGGTIAFHVTNRFLDLVPVVHKLAMAYGMYVVRIDDGGEDGLASRSDWMLLSDRNDLLGREEIVAASTPIEPRNDWELWTDDFNNLVRVLK